MNRAARRRDAKRARQREARRARKDAARQDREAHLTLFHGTAAALDAAIRHHGLRAPTDGRRGPFLTASRERAVRYGVRSAVWRGEQTGERDDRLIIYTVRVPRDELRVDETDEDGAQWWAPGGVPPEWIVSREAFDGGPAVEDREAVVRGMRLMIEVERGGVPPESPARLESLDDLAATLQQQLGDLSVDDGAQRAVDMCAADGHDVLGVGFWRVVLALDGHRVAKVGWRRPYGPYGCLTEAALWLSAAPGFARELLCPCEAVTAAGVLVMRRADPILHPAASVAEQLAAEVEYAERLARPRQQLRDIGLHDDLGPQQWGRLDGRLVVFDYGYADERLDARLEPYRDRLREGWSAT